MTAHFNPLNLTRAQSLAIINLRGPSAHHTVTIDVELLGRKKAALVSRTYGPQNHPTLYSDIYIVGPRGGAKRYAFNLG